jgi:signal peptidase
MRIARLGRPAVHLLCVVVILFCAAWLLPSLFGFDRYVITGGSMAGSIEKGSVAFERSVPVSRLQVGDVITYQPPPEAGVDTLVTHRITSVRENRDGMRVFRTQGDANAAPDPWRFSLSADTQPVVRFSVPKAGYVFIALADRTVRMTLIGGPATLIALIALAEAGRAWRRRDEAESSSETGVPAAMPPGSPAPVTVTG